MSELGQRLSGGWKGRADICGVNAGLMMVWMLLLWLVLVLLLALMVMTLGKH